MSARAVVAILFAFSIPCSLVAQEAEQSPLRVLVAECPPFVISDGGELSGLSIFLWDRIASELGVEYETTEKSLSEMLQSSAEGGNEVGISCLSITREREKIVDFSHSFHETHTAVAVRQRGL